MTEIIKRSSLKDVWLKACHTVLTKGDSVLSERGSKTLEIRNLIMETTNPLNHWNNVKSIWLPKDFMFSKDYLTKYADQLLDGSEKGFKYDYGNRLRGHFGMDQIENVIARLKSNQSSRRAIAITIDPICDYKEEEIPCLQQLTFLVRDSELHITALFRSNDIGLATFANQYAILNLGTYISDRLGLNVGSLVVHAVSAHIYETDIDSIKHVLSKNGWDF